MTNVIVVLGSPNDGKGNLSSIAISRCQKALLEYNRRGNCKILCTGGFGDNFNPTSIAHGCYTRNYLEKQGIPATDFLEIALSAYTLEDATLAKPILEKNNTQNVILVTSEFHMARAKLVFSHIMPHINFSYAESKTDLGEQEFNKLIEHEKKAIKRELTNLQKL